VIELNVPSGVMIFSDWLPGFGFLGSYEGQENSTYKEMMKMAADGCANGYVGNSDPDVFQADGKHLLVARSVPKKDKEKYTEVGRIRTSAWWYAFADLDEFERRTDEDPAQFGQVAVTPGVYRFTHTLPGMRDPNVYAVIEWIREPDPIKDYRNEFREANFTAGQVIRHKMKQWPTSYGGPDGLIHAANYIICVIGPGAGWHPNGFVQSDPDMPTDIEDMEIPEFRQPFDWYPLSGHSTLVQAANGELHLNPSFAALAKKVARSIVGYGTAKYPANKEIARQCLEKLERLYPGI
jgi:hypothetical protein